MAGGGGLGSGWEGDQGDKKKKNRRTKKSTQKTTGATSDEAFSAQDARTCFYDWGRSSSTASLRTTMRPSALKARMALVRAMGGQSSATVGAHARSSWRREPMEIRSPPSNCCRSHSRTLRVGSDEAAVAPEPAPGMQCDAE